MRRQYIDAVRLVSILALHTEGDASRCGATRSTGVSILALHTEGDGATRRLDSAVRMFLSSPSIRRATSRNLSVCRHSLFLSSPSIRRATTRSRTRPDTTSFLSSPSIRRATTTACGQRCCSWSFYPRPPYGGRLDRQHQIIDVVIVSILALHTEGDPFLIAPLDKIHVSILALHTEGDGAVEYTLKWTILFLSSPSIRRATCRSVRRSTESCSFYPRPPYGGRLYAAARRPPFLSSPSIRRATPAARVLPA